MTTKTLKEQIESKEWVCSKKKKNNKRVDMHMHT